jgi:flavin reductase (DIM6/NTAB) family NADH-FMN oxidoreductase RutF
MWESPHGMPICDPRVELHYPPTPWAVRWAMDKKAKKRVLQMIPYGAYVVGTKADGGKDHLMFGTWLMQTSFKPPFVAFALSEDSRTLENVRTSRAFAVSFLKDGMKEIAEQVVEGAFGKVKTSRTPSGLPVVDGSAGWIECKLVDVLDKGDHRIALAEVVEGASGSGQLMPLNELKWHYGG